MKMIDKPPVGRDSFMDEHGNEVMESVDQIHRSKVGRLNGTLLIQGLHSLVDYLQEENDFKSHIQCGRQECSFCCHSEIFITASEAAYIKQSAEYEIDQERLKRQRETDDYNKLSFADKACIMLKNGKCQIYASRPLICRNHSAAVGTDPEECHQQNIEQGKVFVDQPRSPMLEATQFYAIAREPNTIHSIKNIADYEW